MEAMIKTLLSRLIPRAHRARHVHRTPFSAPLLAPAPIAAHPAPAPMRHAPRRRAPAGYVGPTYLARPRLADPGPRPSLFRVT